jgi:hypothetical protein
MKKDKAPGPAVGSNTKKKSLGEGDDESDGDEMAKAAEGGCSCRAHAAEAVAGVDQSVASVAEKVDEAIKSIAGLQELISESTLGIVAGAKSLDEKKLPSPNQGRSFWIARSASRANYRLPLLWQHLRNRDFERTKDSFDDADRAAKGEHGPDPLAGSAPDLFEVGVIRTPSVDNMGERRPVYLSPFCPNRWNHFHCQSSV